MLSLANLFRAGQPDRRVMYRVSPVEQRALPMTDETDHPTGEESLWLSRRNKSRNKVSIVESAKDLSSKHLSH